MERTFSIIKPDGVKKNIVGKIITKFEEQGISPVAIKRKLLSRKESEDFYAIHKERPFFQELVEFMTSGPVVLMVLQGENVIVKNREIMGATNPKEAAKGTIRAEFADSIGENTVHGSDSKENALEEIRYFFSNSEITG